jgi:hypothetical protein
MKTMKVLTETSRSINFRFFQALQVLMDDGKIKSLEAFCKENGLSRPKYSEFRREYSAGSSDAPVSRYKVLDFEAVYSLVAGYGVSAEWIITGSGNMFKPKRK